jgi:hypothetical protein
VVVPLRSLLEPISETVQDLVLAAEERYWDAYELAAQGRVFAAIYLAGFTAEMLLKTAGFRFVGVGPGYPIQPLLAPAKTFGAQHFPAVPCEQYHSLRFWTAFLEHKRIVSVRPLDPVLLAELRTRTDRVYATWWVAMRYRTSTIPAAVAVAAAGEVLGLLEDVDWILKNHSRLWS